jgi:uncharacterized membrane protein YheB (UPF0754 family)
MLGMLGGAKILEPLKNPFEEKMKKAINEIVHTENFQQILFKTLEKSDISEDMEQKINKVIVERLNELNPKMVKDIVENMMKEHLGWLVVWGGVFGGAIGILSSIIL